MKVAELFEDDTHLSGTPEQLREAIATIRKDCKQFLAQSGGKLLFRGTRSRNNVPQYFSKREVRQDRRPFNTDPEVHDQMDAWFYKKFKIKARSQAVFATSNFKEARGYGVVYALFPIGNFKYVWSPKIDDLFIRLEKEHEQDVAGFLDNADYTNQDLKAGIASGHEVMIACDDYYLLLANTPAERDEILRELQDEA